MYIKDNNKYYRTKKGLVNRIYNSQKSGARYRGDPMPTYSLQELRDWCYSQEKFHILYNTWKRSGYKKWCKPSVDRIDPYKSYYFANIQLMTWEENYRKSREEKPGGTVNVPTACYKDGKLICHFPTIKQVANYIGVVPKTVWNYINGYAKTNKQGYHFCKKKIKDTPDEKNTNK